MTPSKNHQKSSAQAVFGNYCHPHQLSGAETRLFILKLSKIVIVQMHILIINNVPQLPQTQMIESVILRDITEVSSPTLIIHQFYTHLE